MLKGFVKRDSSARLVFHLVALLVLLASAVLPAATPTPAYAASLETTFTLGGPIVDPQITGETIAPWTEITLGPKIYHEGGVIRRYSAHYELTFKLVPGAKGYQPYEGEQPYGRPIVPPAGYSGVDYTMSFGGVAWDVRYCIPNNDRFNDQRAAAAEYRRRLLEEVAGGGGDYSLSRRD